MSQLGIAQHVSSYNLHVKPSSVPKLKVCKANLHQIFFLAKPLDGLHRPVKHRVHLTVQRREGGGAGREGARLEAVGSRTAVAKR